MAFWLRATHLVALGLWLGGSAFFSFGTALPILGHTKQLTAQSDNWLNLHTEREGNRLGGEVLTPVFHVYFPFQVACGAVALITALAWWGAPGKAGKARVIVIGLALALASANLVSLAPRVHQLRHERYGADAEVARQADAAFGPAHNVSLSADMATLGLVFAAMVLAAALPPPRP
jgi:hypothetical protein